MRRVMWVCDSFRQTKDYIFCYKTQKIGGVFLSMLLVCGCSFMPSTGPHASLIVKEAKKQSHPPLVNVEPSVAEKLAKSVKEFEARKEKDLLFTLQNTQEKYIENQIYPGDSLNIVLWTQGGQGGVSEGEALGAMVPHRSQMGMFRVDGRGFIYLPYIGLIHIGGMNLYKAQEFIRSKFAATHQFVGIDVVVEPKVSHGQNIVIMGAVNKPSILNWRDGGMNLAEALAWAGGYVVGESLHGTDLGMNILLVRKSRAYNIPLRTALLNKIPLMAGDRITLQHKPSVRVICLGAGWSAPKIAPFAEPPTLSQVMAQVNGLNPQAAQGRAVFIFKHDHSVIYKINFARLPGMEASQIMPVEDGDMVYIPASKSVTMQQILGMFMFVAGQGMSVAAIK